MKGKFRKIIITCIVVTLSFTGCVSSSEHTEVVRQLELVTQEKDTLQGEILNKDTEISGLKEKQVEMTTEVSKLNEEIDELKNGATNLLVQVRNHYENKEYTKGIEVADILHSKYNGQSEDIEAQEIRQQCQTEINRIEEEKKAEAEKLEQERLKSAQDKAREIIRVSKIAKSSPNSAGGVDLFIGYKNMSDKVIKYATFSVVPYNKVGDRVHCDIRDYAQYNAQDEGPHAKGEGIPGNYNWYWQNAWYSWSIDRLELTQIYIEYMDGTSTTLKGDDIKYVQY